MKSAIISKVSGPPGKPGGRSISFDLFNLLLKYPLWKKSQTENIRPIFDKNGVNTIKNTKVNNREHLTEDFNLAQ